MSWSPSSWKAKSAAQQPAYPDASAVDRVLGQLASLPPLVTSWEIESLKSQLAEAAAGKRFLLQGGDCAERFDDCEPSAIANKLKILLQMSLVLVHGMRKRVIRVGRFAGQYAKPRTSDMETRELTTEAQREASDQASPLTDAAGQSLLTRHSSLVTPQKLPAYRGDIVNRPEFTAEARTPDPMNMLRGYERAALTLNFIRALIDGGFADLHHPEYWDLGFVQHSPRAAEYQRIVESIGESLRFMETLAGANVGQINRVDFYTSHEALLLPYEQAQTRQVPRREGWYNLSTHFPWLGMRTGQLDSAHVEYMRGIRNPIAIKIGPMSRIDDVPALLDALHPDDEPGRLTIVHRFGAHQIGARLPELIEAVQKTGRTVLWCCDPMHGNTQNANVETSKRRNVESGRMGEPSAPGSAGGTTSVGAASATGRTIKTRKFEHILAELEQAIDIHRQTGTHLGGVHFELTGENVTECTGGARGVSEADLSRAYRSQVDPRLNYEQALEMALLLAKRAG